MTRTIVETLHLGLGAVEETGRVAATSARTLTMLSLIASDDTIVIVAITSLLAVVIPTARSGRTARSGIRRRPARTS